MRLRHGWTPYALEGGDRGPSVLRCSGQIRAVELDLYESELHLGESKLHLAIRDLPIHYRERIHVLITMTRVCRVLPLAPISIKLNRS